LIRAYPVRALLLWVALHAFVAAASGAGVLAFGTSMSIAMIVIAAAVGFLDARRRHELTLLGNLGIPPTTPSALWAGTILVLEVIMRVFSATA
jgi:hypothetical protein